MHRYATLREAHVKRLACSEKRTEIHQPLAQRRMLGLFPLVVHGFPEEALRPLILLSHTIRDRGFCIADNRKM